MRQTWSRALMRMLALGLSLALLAAPAAAQKTQSGGQGASDGPDPVTMFADDDAVMNAAIDEALASLPLFLRNVFESGAQALPQAQLKIALPTASGSGDEIIWADRVQSLGGDRYMAVLINRPVDLGSLQLGSSVEFSRNAIRDWGLPSADGRLYGQYTSRVIADLTGNQDIWNVLMPDPIPMVWR